MIFHTILARLWLFANAFTTVEIKRDTTEDNIIVSEPKGK